MAGIAFHFDPFKYTYPISLNSYSIQPKEGNISSTIVWTMMHLTNDVQIENQMKISLDEFITYEKCKEIFHLPEKEFSEKEIIHLRDQLIALVEVCLIECKPRIETEIKAFSKKFIEDLPNGRMVDKKHLNKAKLLLGKLLDEKSQRVLWILQNEKMKKLEKKPPSGGTEGRSH